MRIRMIYIESHNPASEIVLYLQFILKRNFCGLLKI